MKSWRFVILPCVCCLLAAALGHREAAAQGICIPEPLAATAMDGRVVYLSSHGEEPVAKAVVELLEYGYNGKRLRRVLTDDNGFFSLRKLHAGKYLLKASKSPYLIRFAVRVNLIEKTESDNRRIVISLGTNALEPCGGGSSTVRNTARP